MTRYTLERAELGPDWDVFVKASPNGTLFSYSAYLEAIGRDVGLWYCVQGEQVKAAFACVETAPGVSYLDDLVVYNGIMFQPPEPDQNVSQVRSEQFKVAEFTAKELLKHYSRLEVQFHPTVVDARPWLWVNYGKGWWHAHYNVGVRYTSHYHPGLYGNERDRGQAMSQSRRQQIRYAQRDGVRVVEAFEPQLFMAWYERTVETTAAFRARLKRLLHHLQHKGLTRWFGAYTTLPEWELRSIAVFGVDNKRAYWLWGLSDPEKRDTPCGTEVVWEGMIRLANDGVGMIDLEGVNSPKRGWFKLSFGGTLEPYWQVRLT